MTLRCHPSAVGGDTVVTSDTPGLRLAEALSCCRLRSPSMHGAVFPVSQSWGSCSMLGDPAAFQAWEVAVVLHFVVLELRLLK